MRYIKTIATPPELLTNSTIRKYFSKSFYQTKLNDNVDDGNKGMEVDRYQQNVSKLTKLSGFGPLRRYGVKRNPSNFANKDLFWLLFYWLI